MPRSRMLAALAAFFVLALVLAGCGSSVPSGSVAVVAGNQITTRAFDHWMFVAAKGNTVQDPTAPVIVPNDPPRFTNCIKEARQDIAALKKTPTKTLRTECATLFQSLSSQVMDFLIKSYWFQLEAHHLHLKISNAAVQKAFNSAMKQQYPTASAFASFLKQTGETRADVIFRERVELVYNKLLARETKKATPAAIRAYYDTHTSQFGTPQTRNLRLIRTHSRSRAQAAKSALASGQSWQKVAKEYSVDTATKDNGGLLLGVTPGEEEAALNQAAFAAPKNKIEGPIHGTFGWYVVEVIKITPATHQSLAKATPVIKELLKTQYQTQAQNDVVNFAKKLWGKQTLCQKAYSMADCHGYKAPKVSTVTPTTSGAGTTGGATATSSAGTTTSSGAGKKKK